MISYVLYSSSARSSPSPPRPADALALSFSSFMCVCVCVCVCGLRCFEMKAVSLLKTEFETGVDADRDAGKDGGDRDISIFYYIQIC